MLATKYVWPLVTSFVLALLGVALMAWPFLVHATAGGFTRAATVDFWSGMGIAVIALLALGSWYIGLKHELVQAGYLTGPEEKADTTMTPASTNPDEDLDRLLRPLAETVLRDLTEQLNAKQRRGSRGGSAS